MQGVKFSDSGFKVCGWFRLWRFAVYCSFGFQGLRFVDSGLRSRVSGLRSIFRALGPGLGD